jgi:hypothetical protein
MTHRFRPIALSLALSSGLALSLAVQWTAPTSGQIKTSRVSADIIADTVETGQVKVKVTDTTATGTMDAAAEAVTMPLENVGIPIVTFTGTCANASTLIVFEYDPGDGVFRTAQAMQFSNPSLDADITGDTALLRFSTGFLCSTANSLEGYWKPQALAGAKKFRVRMDAVGGADTIVATIYGAYAQPDTLYSFMSGAVVHGGTDNGTTVAPPPVKIGCRNYSPTGVQLNQISDLTCDYYGVPFVRQDHPIRFQCQQTVSTATSLTTLPGCTAIASFSYYITDVEFGSSAASGTAADSFPTLKEGTASNCGTNTAVIWQAMSAANTTVVSNFTTPKKVTANRELCWIHSTAGSKTVTVRGWVAP